MSLMNSIQQQPMQFLMPSFAPALSTNPEIAKAAQYGGGGGGGGGMSQPQPAPAGGAPATGLPDPLQAPGGGGGGDIISKIMKMLGGSGGGGGGPDAIMSLLAAL